MNIGIAAPIEVNSLKTYLDNLTQKELSLGLGGTAVNLIIEGLIKQGNRVTVFTLDPSVKDKLVLKGPNLKIIIGHFRANSKLKWFDFCWQEFSQIKKFILEEKDNIDIVNAHWSYEFAIGTLLAKVPHLITFRDHAPTILKLSKYHPYRFFRLLMDYWVRKNGKHFSFNSVYLQSKIKLYKNKKGTIIPNPVKDSIIGSVRNFTESKKNIDICFIANGTGYLKNPENALLGFYQAKKLIKNIQLHFIGSGYEPDNRQLISLLDKKSKADVFFHGKLNHNKLLNKLIDFDILLHTSREESFGNNLIEAMAVGMPVIAGKDAGAVPWVLDYGKAGLLVDIENPIDIADAIRSLISNTDKYEELSLKGIENVRSRFTIDIVTKQYLSTYKEIIYGN